MNNNLCKKILKNYIINCRWLPPMCITSCLINKQIVSTSTWWMSRILFFVCHQPTYNFFVPGFSTLVKIVSPIPELVDNWDSSIKSFHTTQATPRARKMLCRDYSTGRTKKMDVETKNYWEEGIKIRVFAFSFSMNYLWSKREKNECKKLSWIIIVLWSSSWQ